MASLLTSLQQLKQQREERAQAALAQQRRAQAEAERVRERAEQSLQRYRQWSLRRERAMFEALYGQPVRPSALQELREDVQMLRERERHKEDAAQRASLERDRISGQVRSADQIYRQSVRTRDKYDRLVAQEQHSRQQAAEQAEDAEADESYASRYSEGEHNEYHEE